MDAPVKYKYKQIEEYVFNGIFNGEFPVDSMLPTESELCRRFKVSRMTVNKALNNVANMGLIERVQGSGSYVKLVNLQQQSIPMISFSERYAKEGIKTTSRLLKYSLSDISEFSSLLLTKILYINADEKLHYFERLRFGNGKVIAFSRTWVPASRIPSIDINSLSQSFYEYLEKRLKLQLGNGKSTLKVIIPNNEIRNALGLEKNIPVVYVSHVSCFRNGLPFEYVETYSIYNSYKIDFYNKRV